MTFYGSVKMEPSKDENLDKGLEKEVTGYNGRKYTLYELRNSANNFTINDDWEYRKCTKEKYSKVYNCQEETVPAGILKEVYGLDESFEEKWLKDEVRKGYEASNLGRVKYNGKLILQDDENHNGKLRLTTFIDGEEAPNVTEPVYRFVAETFYGNSTGHVHHINNNGYDCRPDNLILLSREEHSKAHGYHIGNEK